MIELGKGGCCARAISVSFLVFCVQAAEQLLLDLGALKWEKLDDG